MNDLKNIDSDLPTLRDENLTNIFYTIIRCMTTKNRIVLMHVIRYIKDSHRFGEPPFKPIKLLLTSYTFGSVSHFNIQKK